jgi:hypothetical protein
MARPRRARTKSYDGSTVTTKAPVRPRTTSTATTKTTSDALARVGMARPTTTNTTTVTPTTTTPVEETTEDVAMPKPVTTSYDPTADIQALAEARRQKQIEGLKSRYDQARLGIEERRTELPQQYKEQRRVASAQSKLGAKSFGEFLARRGLARSGESAQARLMQQSALQGQLGNIGMQEQGALDRLGREERGLEQRYLSDVNMAESGIQADTMEQMIRARQQQDLFSRQDALREQQTRSNFLQQQGILDPYGGARLTPEQLGQVSQYQDNYALALQDPNLDPETRRLIEQARYEKVVGSPELMSQYGREYMTPQAIALQEQKYAQSIAGNVIPDYQAEINKVTGDGDPSNDWQIPLLQAERQRKIAGIQSAEAAQQEQLRSEAEFRLNQFGYVTEQDAQILGVPAGTTSTDYQKIEESIRSAKASEGLRSGELELSREKFEDKGTTTTQPDLNYSNAEKYIQDIAYDSDAEAIDKDKAEATIKSLYDSGRISEQTVRDLVARLRLE